MRIISSSVGNICLSVNISNSTQIIMEFASPSTTFDLCHPVFCFFPTLWRSHGELLLLLLFFCVFNFTLAPV